MEKRLIRSLIVRNDLEEAKSAILAKGMIISIAHVKNSFIAFRNLCELEISIRPLYEANRNLSKVYEELKKAAEFFSYLRNKFASHLTDELIEKALEWKPEILLTLDKDHEPNLILLYNFALLETAINTYVGPDGAHKIFETETDLAYPPDAKRFQDLLIGSIAQASDYLRKVEIIIKPQISVPKFGSLQMQLYMKAGLTDFAYIRGKAI